MILPSREDSTKEKAASAEALIGRGPAVPREHYRELLEQSLVGVYIIYEGRFLYANPRLAEIFGYSVEETLARSVADLVAEPDRALVLENIRKRTQGERTSMRYQFRGRRKDGTVLWVEAHGSRVELDGGQPAVLGVLMDVNDSRLTHAQLKQSEARFRAVIEKSSDLILTLNSDLRVSFSSPSSQKLLGYLPGELESSDMLPLVHPDDKARANEAFASAAAHPGKELRCEMRLRHQNGSWHPFEFVGQASELDESEVTLFLVGREISEWKRAKEEIRKLTLAVEQSPNVVIITDSRGRIEYVNPKFSEVTGYSTEEVQGKNPRLLKSGKTTPEAYRDLWKTVTSGQIWKGELCNRRKNGDLYWAAATIAPMYDAKGGVTHFLAEQEDVTEKRQLEAQLLRTQRLESIGTLAGGVAHDLNNVLTPIVMGASLLRESLEGDHLAVLDTIESSARRGAEVVSQILMFSRGVQGQRAPLQLKHVMHDMVGIAKATFPKNIELEVRASSDLWMALGDTTQIHQVLMNLCVNSRDAMIETGGKIILAGENVLLDENYVRMRGEGQPGRYVLLSVSDTGSGIPPEIRARIFEPFFTTKDTGQGTGLGLSTVLGIVKSHNGLLDVQSEIGHGTTFKIHLPASDQGDEQSLRDANRALPQGNGELILLIEDEAVVLEIMRVTLEASGYRALTATDGTEGISQYILHRDKIAAVVTDVKMPVMDGPTTIRVLRRLDPEVKIIVCSGSPSSERRIEAKETRPAAFLAKPHTAASLLQTLKAVLNGK